MSETAWLIQTSPGAVEWRPVNSTRIRWGLVSSRTNPDSAFDALSPVVSLSVARVDTTDLENCTSILLEGRSYEIQRQDRLYDGDVVRLALAGPPWQPTEADEEQVLTRQLLETSPGAVTWFIDTGVNTVDDVPNWDAVVSVDGIGAGGGGAGGASGSGLSLGRYPGLVNQRTMVDDDTDALVSVTMLEAAAADLLPVSSCTRLVIEGMGVFEMQRRIQQGDGQLVGAILGRQLD